MNQQWERPTSPWSDQYTGGTNQFPSGNLMANQLNYALWGDRFLAALIDLGIAFGFMVVLYIVLFMLTVIVGNVAGAVSPEAGGLLSCGGCLLWLILPPLSYFLIGLYNKSFALSSRGYSIGQGIMKLKVVDQYGNLVSSSTAFMRLICTIALGFVPIVGWGLDILFPLWDPQRQTLHDKAVGTYVIKTE